LFRPSSLLAYRCAETVRCGFTVVNVFVVLGVVELLDVTVSVYFVLNASAPVAFQPDPSVASVPATFFDPCVNVTAVTAAPPDAVTVTELAGETPVEPPGVIATVPVPLGAPPGEEDEDEAGAPLAAGPLVQCACADVEQPLSSNAPTATTAATTPRCVNRVR
jgi:hypothetical protein